MKISTVLEYLQGEGIPFDFTGDADASVDHFSSLARYRPGTFAWIKKQDNIPAGFDLSTLSLVFVSEEVDPGAAPNVIRSPESKRAFFGAIERFYAVEEDRPAIGQFTYLSPKVRLGKNVRIGHNCTLDGEITIGDNTVIWNNVVIVNHVTIGCGCDIQSGTVIGHDGFGLMEKENHHDVDDNYGNRKNLQDFLMIDTILSGYDTDKGTCACFLFRSVRQFCLRESFE